jgi:site-specific DNA-cytosine methylase
LSVCSGIEAATVAWHGHGFQPLAYSEIEKFPRQVLAHHYPDVPLHGDFTVQRNIRTGLKMPMSLSAARLVKRSAWPDSVTASTMIAAI